MKRIQAACICQTLHFMLKEDLTPKEAADLVRQEVEHYKQGLDRNHTRYRIVSETDQPDGSVVLEIIKPSHSRPVGH